MTLAILSPILKWRLDDISVYYDRIIKDAQAYTDAGTQQYNEEREKVIKQRLETYILEEAAKYSCQLDVCVSLTDGFPTEVTLQGNVSPYIRNLLQSIIESNIGIPKENQIWN